MERGAAHTPARAQGREQSIRGGEEVSKVPERGPQGKTGAALAHPSTRRERGRASDSGGPRAPRAQAWHRVRPLRSYQRSRATPTCSSARYSPAEPRDPCLLICPILASGAARHLPAHLPDTRQRSRATPACSSARYSPAEPRDTCLLICLILASGAARHLPAHLPDIRQLSLDTPACSSAS